MPSFVNKDFAIGSFSTTLDIPVHLGAGANNGALFTVWMNANGSATGIVSAVLDPGGANLPLTQGTPHNSGTLFGGSVGVLQGFSIANAGTGDKIARITFDAVINSAGWGSSYTDTGTISAEAFVSGGGTTVAGSSISTSASDLLAGFIAQFGIDNSDPFNATAPTALDYRVLSTDSAFIRGGIFRRPGTGGSIALQAALAAGFDWTVQTWKLSPPATPATGVTMTGPSTGTAGVASTNFSVGVTPIGGTITGTVTVTPSDGGGGGTFTPATVNLTTGSPTATFTYTAASAGAKTISATNDGGLSNPGNLTFTAAAGGTAPSISVQPSSQTVTAPGTAGFSVTASGSGSLAYQWQVSGDGGGTWANVSTGSGGTTPNYTTAATVLGDSGKRYRVSVTGDTAPAATSNGLATLTVQTVPAVTAQPTNQTAAAGASATFTASFSGSPTPNLQWQRSTDGGGTWNNVSTGTGGTTASYTTAATTISGGSANNGDRYRCQATNAAGGPISTDGTASLTVNSVGSAPNISAQPTSQSVVAPNVATFHVGATGTGLAYQWQVSTDNGATWNNVITGTGATTADYSTPPTSTGDTGDRYRVVITGDTAPPATSDGSAVLTVSTGTATSVTVTILAADGATPLANRAGLKFAFFDQVALDALATPTAKGTVPVTDGSGVTTISIVGTSLAPGALGTLVINDSDGTTTQNPSAIGNNSVVQVA